MRKVRNRNLGRKALRIPQQRGINGSRTAESFVVHLRSFTVLAALAAAAANTTAVNFDG